MSLSPVTNLPTTYEEKVTSDKPVERSRSEI